MLLNRQKALLSYIHIAGKVESKTVLTKSMFLLCEEELRCHDRIIYDFFPYKYGPFSFSLSRLDIKKLVDERLISERPYYTVIDKKTAAEIISRLDNTMLSAVKKIYTIYGQMKAWQIKDYVYQRYPYFAIRNDNNGSAYSRHDPAYTPHLQEPKVFTIGYEGKSLDYFLNQLIDNNIKALVDIRNNPRSMKYGFSGNTIRHYCEEIGVKYISIPELGIESKYRKELADEDDYKSLFKVYEKEMLPRHFDKLTVLSNLIINEKRIALMCFEKDHEMCHRGITSRHLISHCANKYGVLHI